MMATPEEVSGAVRAYRKSKTPEDFAVLKKLVSETTFTHQPPQVYGEDPWYDPEAFRSIVIGLSYDETNELLKVAQFKE